MRKARFHTISGEEQARYLLQLDSFLEILTVGLNNTPERISALKNFGEQQDWNWARLPMQQKTYQSLGKLVQQVRENYQWFDWKTDFDDPAQNRGYFEKIEISAESGFPWMFQIMELHRLQREAPKLLEQLPSYQQAALTLRDVLLTDYVPGNEVQAKTNEIHAAALKRNFLEQLQTFNLLGWDSSAFSVEPQATKVIPLGVEDLWNISLIRYSPAAGLFHAYVIDLWQDRSEPQIREVQGTSQGVISADLQRTLKFSEENAAWYILKTIDEKFNSLHPVHVSRAVIGPFETRYLTHPGDLKPLPLTAELLQNELDTGVLRFNRQYSYAPNKDTSGTVSRQIIHQENWNDEIIVCPGAYSSAAAQSVLGTDVRIFKV